MVRVSNGCCNFDKRNAVKKGTKLYSIMKMRCPHCHEGKFFKANPYNLKRAGDIHETCSECGERYSLEPGFYYGAMYVAYGLGVLTFLAGVLITYLINNNASTSVYITVIIGSMVLLGPLYYALSKIIWANLFISYKGRVSQNGKKKRSYES